jgi:hypothetical protein
MIKRSFVLEIVLSQVQRLWVPPVPIASVRSGSPSGEVLDMGIKAMVTRCLGLAIAFAVLSIFTIDEMAANSSDIYLDKLDKALDDLVEFARCSMP